MHPLRLTSLLILVLLPTTAGAAMIGNPVSRPSAGRLALGASADVRAMVFTADGCTGDSCQAVWRPSQLGGRAELSLFPGLGLAGGGSWMRETIDEATFAGVGASYWGGLEAAVTVGPDIYLAGVAQFEYSATREVGSSSGELLGRTASSRLQVAALVAWAPDDDSFALYGGPAFHPLHRHYTTLHDLDVEVTLRRSYPFLGVVGIELRSGPLGLPWATQSSRMVMGVEGRFERGMGGGLWLGAAF